MTIVVDENIDVAVSAALRAAGHTVHDIAEVNPCVGDDWVLDFARSSAGLLLTGDKDFGELVYLQERVTHGVLLVRLSGETRAAKVQLVLGAIARHGSELLGAFSVLTARGLRIRRREPDRGAL